MSNTTIEVLEQVESKMQELEASMFTVLGDKKLSKGMKVIKLNECRQKLKTASAELTELITNKKLLRDVGGRIEITMITSNGRIAYFVPMFENDFIVSKDTLIDETSAIEGSTKVVYRLLSISNPSDNKEFDNLEDAMVEGLILTLEDNPEKETLLTDYKNSHLVSVALNKLKNSNN